MKIGILYICTGKYDRFFIDFYNSCEKLFLVDYEKTYYVFSDSEKIVTQKNIVKINQPKLGWPYDTLMRFHMFSSIKEELSNKDYVFFFNANMLFLQEIKADFLPNSETNNMLAVLHSSFYNTGIRGTFENRKESTAFISNDNNPNYYQGCLFGGKTEEFLRLTEECKSNIDKDVKNNLIAVWHDESHMNKYFSLFTPKSLHPGYAYPETLNLPYDKLIYQLDKSKIPGGHSFLRS